MNDYEALQEITVRGTVADIIFENEDNGYKICEIVCDGNLEITARGSMPFLFAGETVTLTGHYEAHKTYGEQFLVSSYAKEMPQTEEDIETFLASGLIEGVGGATAKAIVQCFGADTVRVILQEPARLETVRGITHARALRIAQTFAEYAQMSDIVVFFNKFGIQTGLALKVYKKYGALSIETVQADPYGLIDTVPEIGFRTADRIGTVLGIRADAGSRICAGILYILRQALGSGHVYLPQDRLLEETAALLHIPQEPIALCADTLAQMNRIRICRDGAQTNVFLSYMAECEHYVAQRLCRLARNTASLDPAHCADSIRQFESDTGLTLDETQRTAIVRSAENGVSIITGGPGTGKTTIVKALVQLLGAQKRKCVLAAPTGRAAKRLSEACGLPAKTIHRLLEFAASSDDPELTQEPDFRRNESNPLDVNVLIIDEMSMVDVLLLYHLLKATPDDAQLILVGDKDQLPSVGPGNVLKDMIRSGRFTTVVLNAIYRQESQSMIAVNAHRIHSGEMPALNRKDTDFFFLPRRTPGDTMATVLDVVCRRLPQTYGIDPKTDIQVLIPNKKGVCGVMNANVQLQNVLNPGEDGREEHTIHGVLFREGDRIMQVRNDYEMEWKKRGAIGVEGKGIFNGEMGVIEAIRPKSREVEIVFDEDRVAVYDYTAMSYIEHCYAITVHKSQGSEFDYCVIPLVPGPPMLMTRNILYTAVTRARKMVVLIGDMRCIEQMIANDTEQMRYTYLTERLEGGDEA